MKPKRAIIIALVLAGLTVRGAGAYDWKKVDEKWDDWLRTSEPELKKKAQAGDAVAKYFYFEKTVSDQPEQDKARWALAEKYLKDASDEGVPQAMHRYAFNMRETDSRQFISHLERAAQTGFPVAEFNLAEELLEGSRVSLDEARAVELLRKAADSNDRDAQYELGELYSCGMGEPRHPKESPLELFIKAANRGQREAAQELADRYRVGYATERDIMEAVRWKFRASQRNSSRTEEHLDDELEPVETKDPNARNFNEFLSLYTRANLQRDVPSMLKVGTAFLEGSFGKKNPLTGYFWLYMASLSGSTEAVVPRDKAKAQLTPAEIESVETEVAKIRAPRNKRPDPQ